MVIDIPTSDIEQRMRVEATRKKAEQNKKAEHETLVKKWSPTEARQVLETKLELLKKAKDSKEVVAFKKNILFDIKNQLKKCAEADITQRREILDHIEYLEDLAGAEIEDVYKEIGPKNKKQIDKIKSFVEEEESDKKKRENLSAQIKQDRTWAHMKGTTVKGQRAEKADYGPTRKTKEAAMARQEESAEALASADIYEEHLKKSTGGWLSRVYDSAKGLLTTKKFEKAAQKIVENEARESMDDAFTAAFDMKFKNFAKDVQNQLWPYLKEAAVGEAWKAIKSGELTWAEGQGAAALQDKFAEILSNPKYMDFAKSLSGAQGEWGRAVTKAQTKSAERAARAPEMSDEAMAATFGGKITAEKPADTTIPSDEEMAASIGKKVAVEKAPRQPFFTRVKEFVNPPSYNVRLEAAGGRIMSREDLKKNEKLVKTITEQVTAAMGKQLEKLANSVNLVGAELKYFKQGFVEKTKLAEEVAGALIDKESNIDSVTMENGVQSALDKAYKEFLAEQKTEQKFVARQLRAKQVKEGREIAAEESEEMIPGESYREALLEKEISPSLMRLAKGLGNGEEKKVLDEIHKKYDRLVKIMKISPAEAERVYPVFRKRMLVDSDALKNRLEGKALTYEKLLNKAFENVQTSKETLEELRKAA